MTTTIRATLIILGLGAACLAAPTKYPSFKVPSSVPVSEPDSVAKARNQRWQTEKWTGSDQPFQQEEQEIEKSLAEGKATAELLDQYQAQAIQHPYDPTAQYGWGYLALKWVEGINANGRDPVYLERVRRLEEAILGMTFTRQPHSYLFSRLLFLAHLEYGRSSDFAVIGQRLLDRNSEDDQVRKKMIDIDEGFYPPKTQKALDSLRYLYRKTPESPKLYSRLGDIYFGEFCTHKQPEMADQAVANWRKSFALAPPDASEIKLFQQNIDYIHKLEAKQKAGQAQKR